MFLKRIPAACRLFLFSVFVYLPIISCFGAVWKVGPSWTYTMPSQVSALVQAGDTVEIDAGNYQSDVCRWTANNLLLKGIGGFAHLESNGLSYGDKAIWVIQGNNITVEWIEFSECTSTSQNGAGIRGEGLNLTVRNCYFHNNENGILIGAYSPCTYLIEYTEFAYNGFGDGFSHNLYIGNIDTLIFRYNYSHHGNIGQELKSRAKVNYVINNRFSNEAAGNASREIDLPNGGLAVIMGNIIQQGLNGTNSNLVGYGMEGLSNPSPHNLYLINNTLVNEKTVGSFVAVNNSTGLYKGYNNIFAGGGSLLSGTPTTLDTLGNNHYPLISSAGFINSSGYDYRLLGSSSAINNSVNAGSASNGYLLTPLFEYVHPAGQMSRFAVGILDVGAHEYGLSVYSGPFTSDQEVSVFTDGEYLSVNTNDKILSIELYDMTGRLISQTASSQISISAYQCGIYLVRVELENGKFTIRKMRISDT